MIFRPAIFHRNVLAFDKACIFQSLPKRVQADRIFVLGHTAKETDNWGCRLLPIYCEWPNGRGPTKKKKYELAPPHRCPSRLRTCHRTDLIEHTGRGPMSALGQKRTCALQLGNVRFTPESGHVQCN